MAEKIVVGLFDSFDAAKAAMTDIVGTGVTSDRISLLANTLIGNHPALADNPSFAGDDVNEDLSEQSHTAVGAEVGLGLGGVLGLLAGVGTLAIPGIGPLIAAGLWATVGAGAVAGGVVGGLVGALSEHGITDKDAHLYAEGLKRGGTLVTVKVPDDHVEPVSKVFKAHGAIDIGKRGDAWAAEGWVAFDPSLHPMTAAELATVNARDDAVEHHHAVRHYVHPAGDTGVYHGGASNMTTRYGEDETRG
jgi:hypothetical protein